MLHPEPGFDYEEKCGRIGMEIEMLILDIILSAVERLNLKMETLNGTENKIDMEPF